MRDKGGCVSETAVRFERLLPGPIERVWDHLTRSEHVAAWFGGVGMKYVIEPKVGGAISLADGHIRGVVTQWAPPRRLAYTWNVLGEGETDSVYPESFVLFDLTQQGDRVLLVLTHRPIADGFEAQTMMGWHTFMDALAAMLRGKTPEPRETAMERNRARYGVTAIKR